MAARLFISEAELQLWLRSRRSCCSCSSSRVFCQRQRRWFSSESSQSSPPKPKSLKKTDLAKKMAEAVKSFVKKHMLHHPGVLPEIKEVHEEVGGSWYKLRDILNEVKSATEPGYKSNNNLKESCIVNTVALEGIDIKDNPDGGEIDDAEHRLGPVMELPSLEESQMIGDKDRTVLAAAEVPEEAVKHEIITTEDRVASEGNDAAPESPFSDFKRYADDSYHGKIPIGGKCMQEMHDPMLEGQNSERKVISLVEFFRRNIGKVEPKAKPTFSDYACQKEDRQSNNLDSSKRKNGLYHHSISYEQQRKQSVPLKLNNTQGEIPEGRSNVNLLLDRLLELAEDKRKSPPNVNGQSGTTNKVNQETKPGTTWNSLQEALKFPNVKCKDTSAGLFTHIRAKDFNTETERGTTVKVNISNFLAGTTEVHANIRIGGSSTKKLQLAKEEQKEELPSLSDTQYVSDCSDSDIAAFDYPKPDASTQSTGRLNVNASSTFEERDRGENRLLVKFLPKMVTAKDIALQFGNCEPISEVHVVPSRRENKFSYAYVYFKTEEGLQKALGKPSVTVGGLDVIMEPSSAKLHFTRSPVEPGGDEDFPLTFLKNINCTVLIKGLPRNTSFRQLKHELSSWGRITGIAMGSMRCNAYVEFESEESKERVLAEASISVTGSKLSIFRVDAPNTTVIRIFNVNPHTMPANVVSTCNNFGQVKRIVTRDASIFDVHFNLSEWLNMTKIINRINGIVVDNHKWLAQPATVFPVEILQAIWSKTDRQKRVQELIQNICRRIERIKIDTASVTSLAQQYYGGSNSESSDYSQKSLPEDYQ